MALLPWFGVNFLPAPATGCWVADGCSSESRQGPNLTQLQFDGEINGGCQERALLEQEVPSARFPLCDAKEREFQAQVKAAARFERRLLCAQIPWKLTAEASSHVAVTKLC